MKKYVAVLMLGACLVLAGVAGAITVENHSFELPGDDPATTDVVEKPGIAEIPGWTGGDVNLWSGAEPGYGPTDGDYTGYMQTGAQIYNLTDHVIAAGEIYELQFDMRKTWFGAAATVDLYFDDAGARTPLGSTLVTFADGASTGMEGQSLVANADDVAGAVGKQLGIQVTCGTLDAYEDGWIGYDNFRMDVIPEPMTIALLGLGALGMIRRRRA